MSDREKQIAAARVLVERLGCATPYAEQIVATLDAEERDALVVLPRDPAVDAAVRLVVKSARLRQALEPIVLAVLNTFDALEMNDQELGQLATRFATAGGETTLDRAIDAGESFEVLGPRPAAVKPDPRHRRIARKLGDE